MPFDRKLLPFSFGAFCAVITGLGCTLPLCRDVLRRNLTGLRRFRTLPPASCIAFISCG